MVVRLPLDALKFNHVCTICKTFVKASAKHCGYCERCVDSFDHHCKWLNNCIGARNYRGFVGLVFTLVLSQGTYIGFVVAFLRLATREEFVERCREYTGWQAENFILAVVSCSGITAVVTGLCALLLLLFHLYLRLVKHMTTYEYVLVRRNKAGAYRRQDLDRTELSDLSRHALLVVEGQSSRLSARVMPAMPHHSPSPPDLCPASQLP